MSTQPPLPYGWIEQVDPESGHIFYVDTKANPPRSIWTHPYEDEVYLSEHPEKRNKVRGSNSFGSDASLPLPPYEAIPRRHSFSGRPATPVGVPTPKHKQGFFDKMKAKAISSMEQHNERKKQQMLLDQQRMEQLFNRPQGSRVYAAPLGAFPRRDYYYGGYGSGMNRYRGGMGGGLGGGMALPLMGGMAGGLLLGDMMGGGLGGGFGGGGFGGDCGGGGFGGF